MHGARDLANYHSKVMDLGGEPETATHFTDPEQF